MSHNKHYTRAFRTSNGNYLYLTLDGVSGECPPEGWQSTSSVPRMLPYAAYGIWGVDSQEEGILVEVHTKEVEKIIKERVVDKVTFL